MTLCSAPTWRIGGVQRTAWFFVLVIYFTLRLEYFLRSFEEITELDNLRVALGCGVIPLDYDFFLTLLWKVELYQLEDIVLW